MGLDEKVSMNVKAISENGLTIAEYASSSKRADKLDKEDITSVRLGLFGEVGSLMATSKKYHREQDAYAAYKDDVIEEFGDTLWYFATLCRRSGYSLDDIVDAASQGDDVISNLVTGTLANAPIASARSFATQTEIDDLLLIVGREAANLLSTDSETSEERERLVTFARAYLSTVQACEIPLFEIVSKNLEKIKSRFIDYKVSDLPVFDACFSEEEQLPKEFKIEFKLRKDGRCYLRWNSVFIGEPLTDNIEDPDFYRFHDVFHCAHAAILHWSPTFRALIKQKRKSDKKTDENQDGGRATVIEEGLTAYIFARAKDLDYFKNQKSVSFDLLKTIGKFVRGYEVEECPLKLWEEAILRGYDVFRQLRDNRGGKVVGNRENRTIEYVSLEE